MMKKIINPWRNHPEHNCFGCCPENPIGLHMEFHEEGDYIVSKWHPAKNYQGWVNTMHGGILRTLGGKWFLLTELDVPEPWICVKLEPEIGERLREQYEGVHPDDSDGASCCIDGSGC